MLASTSRLDLGITVRPKIPAHIETILSASDPLPIFIDHPIDGTGSALSGIRAALEQHDRVREISFVGTSAWFEDIFRNTNCSFPILESLSLCSRNGYEELKLPDTFLGGPDLSNLHLQHLRLEGFSLISTSGLLFSLSTLTTLSLQINTAFGISPETSLLACLQGMPCLCRIDLVTPSSPLSSPPPPSALNDIVPLLKLTYFRYVGQSVFMDAIVAGLSAPFLQDLRMAFHDEILPSIVHLPRFISETEKPYHSLFVTLRNWIFRVKPSTQLECTSQRSRCGWLYFKPPEVPTLSTQSIIQVSGTLSAKLTTVEELCISFSFAMTATEDHIPWRRFYQQFPSVKVVRTYGIDYDCIVRMLLQDDLKDVAIFPVLEEIEFGNEGWSDDPEMASRSESEPTALETFIFARQQAGRPVKISIRP
jgi:hypothetical protein